MYEIQNGGLTIKERKKRDKALQKEKRKEVRKDDERIANLSLSDSNISNRIKVIIREANNTWAIRKKLGFSVRGDEEKVIEEIMRAEINKVLKSWRESKTGGLFSRKQLDMMKLCLQEMFGGFGRSGVGLISNQMQHLVHFLHMVVLSYLCVELQMRTEFGCGGVLSDKEGDGREFFSSFIASNVSNIIESGALKKFMVAAPFF
ncbi:hypothetical protein J1N35_028673 [Gossypium stocksii]|uniref:Uncharacterized protein n=1 Tax=Gossypium stocksii TaxID=47602 RepID=A0A9D3UWN9_9ROSI|nr:hypothetical protein J1N35_028673 [Gossypium stocksii]